MEELPFATGELPGCGGAFKLAPEDFEVEEVPAYLPSGEGEHLFLWIEKRGLSTPVAQKLLARHLGLPPGQVFAAGLKDQQAVSRQWLCVPASAQAEAKAAGLAEPGLRVLLARRHRNKLKAGHLKGNRFRLRLRGVRDFACLKATLEVLARRGVPNYFGQQRFGRAGDNAELGRRLLLGERLDKRPDRFERRLYLSAFQSLLFNRALAARVRSGTFDQALPGDVLVRHESGGAFVCEDVAVDGPRVQRFEVSPAGPLFGPKLLPARAAVAEQEAALLAEAGVTLKSFEAGGGETQGARRPYRVPLEELKVTAEGEDALLELFLPAGSYATGVLRELLKA